MGSIGFAYGQDYIELAYVFATILALGGYQI